MKKRPKNIHKYQCPRFLDEYWTFDHILRERFLGIDQACSQVAALMASHLIRAKVGSGIVNSRCLISGLTSSGKSSLISEAARNLNAPFITINCTGLTPEGYKGNNLSQCLQSLVHQAGNRGISYAENYGIVFLDEFDKLWLGRQCEGDSYRRAIVAGLLPIFGGEPILIPEVHESDSLMGDYGQNPPMTFQTKGLMVFCAGVFTAVPENSWKDNGNAIKALLRMGMPSELCSRLTHIIRLKRPNKKEVEELIGRQAKELGLVYQTGGERLSLSEREIKDIGKRIASHTLGLRFSRNLIHKAYFEQIKAMGIDDLH